MSTNGNGTVASTDGFINCPTNCSHSYPVNTQVTLNASPAQGWSFAGWSGDCTGTGSCALTMTQDFSVVANFIPTPFYTLTVTANGNGTVTSTDGSIDCPGTCSNSYPAGTPVTLNEMPADGLELQRLERRLQRNGRLQRNDDPRPVGDGHFHATK